MKYTLYNTDIPNEGKLYELFLDTFFEVWNQISDDEPIAFYGIGSAYSLMKVLVTGGKPKAAYTKNVVCIIENNPKKRELNTFNDSNLIGIEHIADYKFSRVFLTGFEHRHQMRRDIINYDENIEIIDIYEILERRGVYYDRPYYKYIKRSCSFGDLNPGVTFYVIRCSIRQLGLFSHYRQVLANIMIARKNGFVPVIDMENFKVHYNEDTVINGTRNAWEYYFQQPDNYTIEEVYKSKNVILSPGVPIHKVIEERTYSNQEVRYYNKTIVENIKLNDYIFPYIESRVSKTLPLGRKVLGVIARGTDYASLQLEAHAGQPDVCELIALVKTKLNEWRMDCVYLATEDLTIVDSFKQAFPDTLVMTDSLRFGNYDKEKHLADVRHDREHDKYYTGLEYLSDIIILSQCNAFIGARCSGRAGALFLNGGEYEHTHLIDIGNY